MGGGLSQNLSFVEGRPAIAPLCLEDLKEMLAGAIASLDIDQVRVEVTPFVRDPRALEVWSREFFMDVIGRILPAAPTPAAP